MINWGIIGCGNVTELKSGPAFGKVPGSRLVAVMRRNRSLAEDYAQRHKVPKVYDNADKLINDPDINAVYVATPPSSHMEYALKVIEAGKPVYIEKPMAANYGECVKINESAAKNNIPVFVAYYRRTLPGFLLVKEMIEKGSIGRVRFVRLQLLKAFSEDEKEGRLPWRVIPEIAGGGHFFDLASHQLDYLDFLFGPVELVNGIALNQGNKYKAEDYVSAEFVFPDKIAGSGTWCFNLFEGTDKDLIEIYGEKGSIIFPTFTFEPIILTDEKGTHVFQNDRPENIQYYLINQIVRSLEGKGSVVSTGVTAARTSRIMDEIVKGYYS
jgi:predicted dehydrogenase